MTFMRDPEAIEADLLKSDSVELLSFLWGQYYDSANYDKRRDQYIIARVGHKAAQLKQTLIKEGKIRNTLGDCLSCRRPKQACICFPD